MAGEGGVGIKHHAASILIGQRDIKTSPADAADQYYWQRYVAGIPMSVLFLADGQNAQNIGFNQQWARPESYVFSGVMSQAALPDEQKELVVDWITKLVPVFALKGLCSLDFIWDGVSCWLLEINPRPSASMILYDDDLTKGLLYAHIDACNGKFVDHLYLKKSIKACHIIYSETELRIPAGIHWPEWSMDHPMAGTFIRTDHPICSIIATGNRPQEVYNELKERQQILINKLEG